jgi:hypothetical protein
MRVRPHWSGSPCADDGKPNKPKEKAMTKTQEEVMTIDADTRKEWDEYIARQRDNVMRSLGCYKILKRKKVFKPQMYFWNVEVLCEFCDKLKTIENETKECEVVNG